MPTPASPQTASRATVDRQMAQRREQILEAARSVIERDGYAGLSMRSLATRSGVTVPTIYNLVGNKEAVLLAAVEEQTAVFLTSLERAPRELSAVIEATVRHLTRRPRYYRALIVALSQSGNTDDARRLVSRAVERQILSCLARLHEQNSLEAWVETHTLTERLQAGLDAAALEWARGALTTAGFGAAALYSMALCMAGVSRGETAERFRELARRHQEGAVRRKKNGSRDASVDLEGRAA